MKRRVRRWLRRGLRPLADRLVGFCSPTLATYPVVERRIEPQHMSCRQVVSKQLLAQFGKDEAIEMVRQQNGVPDGVTAITGLIGDYTPAGFVGVEWRWLIWDLNKEDT